MSKKSKRAGQRPPSQRQLRVGEELRHVISQVIERGDLHDPDLAGVSITVSEVRISPDLGNATIFVTRLGGGQAAEMIEALGRAAPFLRRQVAEKVHLRRVPNLIFEADTSFDYAEHIGHILEDVQGDDAEQPERISQEED
ncbi:MAG: 30S ribosome-binding factor RbfA [Rhodospirillaceae bacterium]|nr:30S ribosome-binding factor RbfA [Rhodospirillaceae bacterium]MBT5938551.1 30S ribosome-binding factor RbfA [Rhodospirillaceae bacterium]MBT7266010.1 30S ribosome-binding factor RbfA [Rhodospirillaceae bacterium]